MHFIKQRAATTGSHLESLLAHLFRLLSIPSLEPRLSYKGIMLNVPGFVSPLNQIPKPPARYSCINHSHPVPQTGLIPVNQPIP